MESKKNWWLVDTTVSWAMEMDIPGFEILSEDEYCDFKKRIGKLKKFTNYVALGEEVSVDKTEIKDMLNSAVPISNRDKKRLACVNQCQNSIVKDFFHVYDATHPVTARTVRKKRVMPNNGFNGNPVEMAVWNTPLIRSQEPVKYIRTVVAYEPDSAEGRKGRPWKTKISETSYRYWEHAQKVR